MTDAARRPIRTAVIGFGTSGRIFHAPFLAADPDFSLDAIVTRDPSRIRSMTRVRSRRSAPHEAAWAARRSSNVRRSTPHAVRGPPPSA